MMGSDTNIPIDEETRRRLRVYKSKHDESYAEAINRLLNMVDEND